MKYLTLTFAAFLFILAGGCSTTGLPPGAQVVGGGLRIDWFPPEDGGTAMLVEQRTRKVVSTQSVNKITAFNFDASTQEGMDLLKAVFPSQPQNAQFILYYVPPTER